MNIDYNEVTDIINQIKRKIIELEEETNKIDILLQETIKIDEKIPKEQELLEISTRNTEIINEIAAAVLPSIYQKQ